MIWRQGCYTLYYILGCGPVGTLPIEAGLLVILSIGHLEELAPGHDSGGYAFKQGIAALDNVADDCYAWAG